MKSTYQKPAGDSFSLELQLMIQDYFKHKSKKANALYWFKAWSYVLFFGLAYYSLLTVERSYGGVLLMFMLLGVLATFLLFNIGHDASHHACSSKPKVNTLVSYIWNFLGISHYFWELKHNVAHHPFTNVIGLDGDIDATKIIRLSPRQERKPYHRFQHIYAWGVYCLIAFFTVYMRDFRLLATHQFGNTTIARHPQKEFWIALFSKVIFVAYMVVIPKYVLDLTWPQAIIAHLCMLAIAGFLISIALIPAHLVEGVTFQVPDEQGIIHDNFFHHQVVNTVDFAARSRIVNWLLGGLNTHVAHHLLPNVCHIHYFDLTGKIKALADKHQVPYRNISLLRFLHIHAHFLKRLGRENDPTGVLSRTTHAAFA